MGFITLARVAAETGVIMLIYLDHALEAIKARRRAANEPLTLADIHAAVMEGAVERVRPKDDDGGGHHGGIAAHHVGLWRRLGSHAVHRRADGGRDDLLDGAHPGGDPGDLCLG